MTDGLDGETSGSWPSTEPARAYVRNIEANPRVRVRIGSASGGRKCRCAPWRRPAGLRPKDDQAHPEAITVNAATVALVRQLLLTVRVDLDPEG